MKKLILILVIYTQPAWASLPPLEKVNFSLSKLMAPQLGLQCSTAANDLELYIRLQQQNIDFVDQYLNKTLSLLASWNRIFEQVDGRNLIPPGYFAPLSGMSIGLNEASTRLEANKLLLDDTLYAITELVGSCEFAEDISIALDDLNYAARDAETTFKEGVLDNTSLKLLARNNQLKKLESRSAAIPFEVKSYFLNLASDRAGSSGVGEAQWLFTEIFKNYQKQAQKILLRLKPTSGADKITP